MQAANFEHTPIDLGYEDLGCITESTGRRYQTPKGTAYPSITTVLSVLSKDSIAKWRAKVGDAEADKISYRASTRGSLVHECIEEYINNEDWSLLQAKYTPDIIQSLISVRSILNERIGKVYGQELPLYSDHLGIAGRVDCVAQFDGKPAIIDFKTSKRPKPRKFVKSYFQQEAGYAIMWEERTGMPITQLVTIIAVDNEDPQVFIEHRDDWAEELLKTIELYKNQPVTLC
jgi:hypothetical protein